MRNRWGKSGNSVRLPWAPKSLQMVIVAILLAGPIFLLFVLFQDQLYFLISYIFLSLL